MSHYRIEPLAAHDRGAFACGNSDLDRYFRQFVGQDVRRGAATAFVAVDVDTGEVAGFYTLSATGLDRTELPPQQAPKAPRYSRVPAILIGRLAVALTHQGQGLGGSLLIDAFRRTLASGIGVHLVAVQPKDDRARAFYSKWGFEPLMGPTGIMYVPIDTLKLLQRQGHILPVNPR